MPGITHRQVEATARQVIGSAGTPNAGEIVGYLKQYAEIESVPAQALLRGLVRTAGQRTCPTGPAKQFARFGLSDLLPSLWFHRHLARLSATQIGLLACRGPQHGAF